MPQEHRVSTGIPRFTLLMWGPKKTGKQKPHKLRLLSSTKGEENRIEFQTMLKRKLRKSKPLQSMNACSRDSKTFHRDLTETYAILPTLPTSDHITLLEQAKTKESKVRCQHQQPIPHHSKMQKDEWVKYIPNFAFK